MQESKSSFIDINNPITSYQVANLFMMMLGMFVGVLFYNERQTVTDAVTDIFSHLFMLLLASTIFNEYNRRDVLYINCLLEVIVTLGAVIHGSMLLYARFVNNTLFGKVLWLGNQTRFIGLAINPHQIGMIGGPGLFFALYLMSMTDNIWTKLRYILLAIVWFMVSDATKSDTMNASYVLCFVAFLIFKSSKVGGLRERRYLPVLVICMLCLGISFQLPRLWNILTDFVMDGGNGEHRLLQGIRPR